MKKLMSLAMVGLFAVSSVAMVGCKASGEIEGADHDGSSKTTVKKTTVEPDGDKKVTTETKTNY